MAFPSGVDFLCRPVVPLGATLARTSSDAHDRDFQPRHSDFDRPAIGSNVDSVANRKRLRLADAFLYFVILGQARSEATRRRP